jgi:hypothetical protein
VSYNARTLVLDQKTRFAGCNATSITLSEGQAAGIAPGHVLTGWLDTIATEGSHICNVINRRVTGLVRDVRGNVVLLTTPAELNDIFSSLNVHMNDTAVALVDTPVIVFNGTVAPATVTGGKRRLLGQVPQLVLKTQWGDRKEGVKAEFAPLMFDLTFEPVVGMDWAWDDGWLFRSVKVMLGGVANLKLKGRITTVGVYKEADLFLDILRLKPPFVVFTFQVGVVPVSVTVSPLITLGISGAVSKVPLDFEVSYPLSVGVVGGYNPLVSALTYVKSLTRASTTPSVVVNELPQGLCTMDIAPKAAVGFTTTFGLTTPLGIGKVIGWLGGKDVTVDVAELQAPVVEFSLPVSLPCQAWGVWELGS